jgi:hypothetical protein
LYHQNLPAFVPYTVKSNVTVPEAAARPEIHPPPGPLTGSVYRINDVGAAIVLTVNPRDEAVATQFVPKAIPDGVGGTK